jgi:hypothetical protein
VGQITAVDRLPEALRNKVLELLKTPYLYQFEIVDKINAEAGKPVLSRSSLNRFIRNMEKKTGTKREKKALTAEESLGRIATALEKIADFMEKQYKEPGQ